ncbi:Na+/H+ antiporter subunit G [Siminovitchia sediminis]|uniref:Na+/H+ antiporter subunit G n=1 Tax=Siminovitchia sediminis TaxID=1274353 RepID=A0ABW4KH48_9BACI
MNAGGIDEIIGATLILAGGVISVISALGIIRFPDVYTRSHAATKSTTLGVLLSLVGAFLYIWMTENYISVRLILGIVFVFITAPVSGHLMIRAAYRSKVKMTEDTVGDELQAVLNNKPEGHQ